MRPPRLIEIPPSYKVVLELRPERLSDRRHIRVVSALLRAAVRARSGRLRGGRRPRRTRVGTRHDRATAPHTSPSRPITSSSRFETACGRTTRLAMASNRTCWRNSLCLKTRCRQPASWSGRWWSLRRTMRSLPPPSRRPMIRESNVFSSARRTKTSPNVCEERASCNSIAVPASPATKPA